MSKIITNNELIFETNIQDLNSNKVKRAVINGRHWLRYEVCTIIRATEIIVSCLDAPVKNSPMEAHPLQFPKEHVFRLGVTNTGINKWVKFHSHKKYENDNHEVIHEYKFNIMP